MLPGLALVSEWLGGGWMVEYGHTPVSWPQLDGLAEFLSLRWSVVTASTQQGRAFSTAEIAGSLGGCDSEFLPSPSCHFYYVLLVKASQRANSHSRDG